MCMCTYELNHVFEVFEWWRRRTCKCQIQGAVGAVVAAAVAVARVGVSWGSAVERAVRASSLSHP